MEITPEKQAHINKMAEDFPHHQGATIFYLMAKGETQGNVDF
jgi:hypothetical protein